MNESEGRLRGIARKRVEARMGLYIHLVMYLAVNTALVVVWSLTKASYPWFVWPMIGWGVGIVGHVMTYFFGPGSPGAERAYQRELHRLQERPH